MIEEIHVTDRPELGRYELTFEGTVAGVIEYHDRSGTGIFDHTVVGERFAGRRMGAASPSALEDALEQGLAVAIRCPFLRAYDERNAGIAARITARNRQRRVVPSDGRPRDEWLRR